MKICFLTFACPNWSLDEVISGALRHRYHGVEFRCDAGHAHGVEVDSDQKFRGYVRRRFADEGLEIPCLSTSIKLAEMEDTVEALARIQLAADIGAKAIRVFCGPAEEKMPKADVIQLAADRLLLLANLSEPTGVEIWLETHDTLHRAADAAAAVRLAGHPLVAINYDNMHPYRMHESLDETFAALDGLIRHSHMHDAEADDELHRAVILPLDEGDMPMDGMFQRLVSSGYDGYLGGEWFENEYGPSPNESLESFRNQMDTLAARNGASLES